MDFVVMNAGTNFRLMPVTDKAKTWSIENRERARFPFVTYQNNCFLVEGKRMNEAIVTFGTGMVTGIYFCNIQKPKLGTYSQGDVVNPNFITNIESLSSKIDAVYKAVVEFIQWYNQNRKQ